MLKVAALSALEIPNGSAKGNSGQEFDLFGRELYSYGCKLFRSRRKPVER